MKIFEKKCPNCHANLEFKVGEKDVVCPSCRRTFAIEYDHDIVDPEVMLKAKDIQLKILDEVQDSFIAARKVRKIVMPIVLIFIAAMFAFGIFMFVQTRIRIEEDRKKAEEQSQQFEEQFQKAKDQIEQSQPYIMPGAN